MGKKSGQVNVSDIARTAALEALKIFKEQEKEKVKKRRLHNTGLLLDHYLDLLDHYENSKYSAAEISEDIEDFNFDSIEIDDIVINAIKRSKIRTMIMINHV